MRLSRVDVEGLFNTFDHSIPLDHPDRVTIIYGPNGIGKTTVLRLIESLFSGRFTYLKKVPFDRLTFLFDDDETLVIQQVVEGSVDNEDQKTNRPLPTLHFTLSAQGRVRRRHAMPPISPRDPEYRLAPGLIDRRIDWLERVGSKLWQDQRSGEVLEFEEVLDRYADLVPVEPLSRSLPKWLAELINRVSVLFIQTQRLLALEEEELIRARVRPPRMGPTVVNYSHHVTQEIQKKIAESAAISQQLDRTFPSRLLRPKKGRIPTDASVRQKYREQGERQRRLIDAGLLRAQQDLPPLPTRTLTTQERKILSAYLADVDKKLKVFDDLLPRIELLREILNTSFRHKQVRIDSREGLIVDSGGSEVALIDLSSGEQHELVVTYQLLFRIQPGSLILIDEPEISLHVSWQHKFLEDIRRISDLVDLDFLIATHSPQIIHKRWDLAVSLED